MSKSLGNFLLLKDLLERGHDPRSIRYTLLSTHYRSKLNLTDKSLWSSRQAVEKLDNFMDLLGEVKRGRKNPTVSKMIRETKKGFREAMDDDLNISLALSRIFDFVRDTNKLMDRGKVGKKDAQKVRNFMKKIDTVLGVLKEDKGIPKETVEKVISMLVEIRSDITEKDKKLAGKLDKILAGMKGKEYDPENFDILISGIIDIRETLRKKKEYGLSDKIRADLKENGVILEDKTEGERWRMA